MKNTEYIHQVITATVLLVGLWFILKPRRRKVPARMREARKGVLQSYEVLRECIPMCMDENQLHAIELQVDDFYLNNVDFVQVDVMKSFMKVLNRSIYTQRIKIRKHKTLG